MGNLVEAFVRELASARRSAARRHAGAALLCLAAGSIHAGEPIKGPGDPTLFGNPTCRLWPKVDQADKLTWLNAIVGTLIVTRRINTKGIKDPYNTQALLQQGTLSVDDYCAGKPDAQAIDGAAKFLETVRADETAASAPR